MPNVGRRIKPPAMKDIPAGIDPKLVPLLEAIIGHVNLREGFSSPRTNSRFVTIQDLVDAGVVADGKII